MKNTAFLICLMFVVVTTEAQKNYTSTYAGNKGKVHFFSSTPLEDIEATSNSAICVMDMKTKKVVSKVPMNTMVFEKKLMQEHFNEKYIESDKFPNAILDAVIVENLDLSKDSTYAITLRGTFEVHGVKQARDIAGMLTIKDGKPVSATASFMVKLADHKIKIPSVVALNIAESVKVDVAFSFVKYHKK